MASVRVLGFVSLSPTYVDHYVSAFGACPERVNECCALLVRKDQYALLARREALSRGSSASINYVSTGADSALRHSPGLRSESV